MQNLASVIIVNYNGADYLQACLDSVLRQGYDGFEVIVVDNDSVDHSRQVLEQYSGRVKAVFLAENIGFGGGCLEGLRQAEGEFVVLLNSDTVVAKDWLEKLLEPFKGNPHIGSCAAKMLMEGTDLFDSAGMDFTYGHNLCLAGQMAEGRRHLARAVKRDKYNFKHLAAYLCSFFGRQFYSALYRRVVR